MRRTRIPYGVALAAMLAAAACQPPPSRTVAPAPVEEDTTLGPGDVFDVRVFGEEELSGTYRVQRAGTIDFPFIGRIEVGGLTPPEVSDLIASRLRDGEVLVAPQVSVLVQEYNSKRVVVNGAVSRPGEFPISPGMTVAHAISLAGGFTSVADRNGVLVTREVEGEVRRIRVRVSDVLEGRSPDVRLRSGDTVYVPERAF